MTIICHIMLSLSTQSVMHDSAQRLSSTYCNLTCCSQQVRLSVELRRGAECGLCTFDKLARLIKCSIADLCSLCRHASLGLRRGESPEAWLLGESFQGAMVVLCRW